MPRPENTNTTITIRIPARLRQRIREQAEREHRTESSLVRFYISQILEQKPRTKARA
jgi:predicted DNA-binding protein